jgi:uncharacterized membrane protein
MLIVTTVGAIGQLLLKSGISQAHRSPSLLGIVKIMLTEPRVFFGLVLFALNTILYLRVLQEYPLSVVYPMIAISYVVTTLLAWLFLGEKIPPLRVIGLMTICLGVLLLAASAGSARFSKTDKTDLAPTSDSQ